MITVEVPEPEAPGAVDTTPVTGRRAFLRWATAACAVASGALIGVPTLRALFSPGFKRPAPETWTKMGDASAFELNVPVRIDFSDTVKDGWVVKREMRSVWMFTPDGRQFIAYNARCTHLGCGFDYDAQAKNFQCPCHAGRFDAQTGARLAGPPPRGLDRLKVKTVEGVVYVVYQEFRLGVPDVVPV
jgi:menaquinol-cytochrome c reductase iron-sulfur subunit